MRSAYTVLVMKESNPIEYLAKINDIDYIYDYLQSKEGAGEWHQGCIDWELPFSMNTYGMTAEQKGYYQDYAGGVIDEVEEGYNSE